MSDIICKLKSIVGENSGVILELGSCEGEDSSRLLNAFRHAQLFCFEPDPKNCADHRSRISNKRCVLTEAAISDENGIVVFHRSGGRPRRASGSIRSPKDHLTRHPWCTFNEDIKVRCMTMDTWRDNNGIDVIDLIWADVNGAETSMIKGGQSALSRTRYLYTEFGPDDAEVYEGGVTKQQLLALLPDFDEVLTNNNNVLLKNRTLP